MKKIILILVMICNYAYGQDTLSYSLKRENYDFDNYVRVRKGLTIRSYLDTTAANTAKASQIPGLLIRVNNDFFLRDTAHHIWLKFLLEGNGSSTCMQGLKPNTGQVIKLTDSTFAVTSPTFWINCVQYSAAGATLEIDNYGATSRIDGLFANINGTLQVIKGAEGLSLTFPPYGADTLFPLAFVLVTNTSVISGPVPTDSLWIGAGLSNNQKAGRSGGQLNGTWVISSSGKLLVQASSATGSQMHIVNTSHSGIDLIISTNSDSTATFSFIGGSSAIGITKSNGIKTPSVGIATLDTTAYAIDLIDKSTGEHKKSSTWTIPGSGSGGGGSGIGSPTWGSITGTLSSQTDLSASLAGKKDKSDTSSSPGGYTTLYRNNLKMDSTTIRNDTVFNWHNGIRVFGFKIIASGTPDLLAVTSVDSATPHALLINGSILRSTNGGGSLFWGFRSGSGLDPGDGNTGVNVFGVGTSAATNNTANGVFVVGFQAGKNNSGGNTVGIGSGAANGNSGHDINAFGNLAGQSNTFNIVNLFGPGATADADKQNVYSDGTFSLIESFTGMTHNNKITKPDSTGTYILRINGQSPNSKGSFATTLATQQALQDSASAIRAAIAAIPGGSTPAGIGMNTGDGNMNMGGDIGTTVVDVRSSVSDMGFYLDPNGRFMQIGTSGVHGDFDIDNDLVDLSSFGKTKLSGVVSSRGVDYLFPLSGGPGALVNDGSNNLSWAPILSEPPITAPNTSKKYWTGYKTFGVMNSDTLIEGSANLFFTNTRARSAISLTTTGTGAATYNSSTGLLNIPTTGGGGSTNTSIGSGIKIAVDGTNNIKSVHAGSYIIIDSTSNSDEVTYMVDTASLFADFPRTTIHVDTTTLAFSGDSLSVKPGYKEQTFTIDLSLGDYTITGPGIYEVTHGSLPGEAGTRIFFPDPTLFNGQSITIVNDDATDNRDALYAGDYFPFINGNNFTFSGLPYSQMHIYKSIGGNWRGAGLYAP